MARTITDVGFNNTPRMTVMDSRARQPRREPPFKTFAKHQWRLCDVIAQWVKPAMTRQSPAHLLGRSGVGST